MNPLIETIKAIEVETPVEKIIRQLKHLIVSGQLKPGDRLPAERVLAEKFGVGRSYVREAILKLEFYGLLKTSPQSGTYVSGLSINVLDNLLTDLINFNKDDFNALIEARYYLELSAVRVAAERRTEEDLHAMERALDEYEYKIAQGLNGVEEDLLFHIKIARATKNPVIESMLLILIPDLVKSINENKVCGEERGLLSIPEHRAILKALEEKDSDAAEKAMANHLNEIFQISRAGYDAKKLLDNNAE
ncbi:GntR family transcriptional regulator [Arcticibacter tournemirensis]|uniref:FadR family transcriptional regulator n=1 Tax=Arcticibacter tournemirensis TaxID=699437 RepID=A0A5M9H6F3_9SPHI|nr:FadR/GntR family transcriptional regulator [Arcticibacter tournemirensis]KAA8482230.1 FadR family transcriptional regulator [Arcticibacter tournemirensis]TQM52369.1 GntR family transcriptional regulator [Arcticibacter tournemirensis]